MKKTYFLILLCCISSSSIFSAQKGTVQKSQDLKTRELIDSWNRQEVAQKERETKIRNDIYREQYNDQERHAREIAQLKEAHAAEIVLYQKKIDALVTLLETKSSPRKNNQKNTDITNAIQIKNPQAIIKSIE
jgi:hypothetical protein